VGSRRAKATAIGTDDAIAVPGDVSAPDPAPGDDRGAGRASEAVADGAAPAAPISETEPRWSLWGDAET
jgi:hypothetical protein